MKRLNSSMMSHLSFPDFEVQEMSIDFLGKQVRIHVSGGYLDISDGEKLGRGLIVVEDWTSLTVVKYDGSNKNGRKLNEAEIEPLKDLCEVCFSDSQSTLAGFGKKSGEWMEWEISLPKIYAEFQEL